MRDYAKVGPKFWIGKTGKALRAAGPIAQVVAMYLMTSPHANMLGLYHLPVSYIATDTGLGQEGASKGLQSCIEAGYCTYDEESEMVWVHEMAFYQIADSLLTSDKRSAGVQNEYNGLPDNSFLAPFFAKYASAFNMTKQRGLSGHSERPIEGPYKALASQEQAHEQAQEQAQATAAAVPAAEYSPEFEIAWAMYPQRPGANKKKSYKAWTARLKAGVDFVSITSGVERYAHYCDAMRTEPQFIKQPETFFGPDEHYRADWTPMQARASPANDLAAINARNNAEAKLRLFGTDDQRTIDA